MSRSHPYTDPLDAIWVECARRVGLRVVRSTETYASTDGRGTLMLGDRDSLDSDDCLAQMVLHELCHSLVCGRESFEWVDWGLDNETGRDVDLEYATLRLQAALLDRNGLRTVLAPTTDYRVFYDALPADPFAERDPSERSSIIRGRAGYARRKERPWGPHLEEALEATRQVLAAVASYRGEEGGDLLAQSAPKFGRHRSGLPARPGPLPSEPTAGELPRCEGCGWFIRRTSGRHGCRQAERARIDPADSACAHFEPELDCRSCGACCREAYDAVVVSPRDPAVLLAPSLLVRRGRSYELPRPEKRCAALLGGAALPLQRPAIASPGADAAQVSPPFLIPGDTPFSCTIYDVRPKTCRDFTRGSKHCLTARRRVGLSR